ncbi:hypothetical protein [Micromonospora sp. NPDC005806]
MTAPRRVWWTNCVGESPRRHDGRLGLADWGALTAPAPATG